MHLDVHWHLFVAMVFYYTMETVNYVNVIWFYVPLVKMLLGAPVTTIVW
jgi:hypothetical protein